MKIKFYALLLVLLPLCSIAQSNFKSGYAINVKGDTLRGYMDYKEWNRNPESINFKTVLSEKSRRLTIDDIRYFEITGAVSYKRYLVNISLNSVDISSVPSLRDTASRTDNVLLKVVQKGTYLTLYSYTDAVKSRLYIRESNIDTPKELIYGIYQNPGNSSNTIELNTFRDQLTQLAVKYAPTADKTISNIKSVRYNEADVRPIVAGINRDVITSAPLIAGANPPIRFFIGAAYNQSTLKYEGASPIGTNAPSNSGSPKITLGVDAFTNPDVGHLLFRLELAYDKQTAYSFKQIPDNVPIIEGSAKSQKLSISDFSITPQIIYNLYNGIKLKVFADVGYTFNISSYSGEVTTRDYFGVHKDPNMDEIPYDGFWTGFQFKAGLVVAKRVEVYAAYYPGASLSRTAAFYSATLSSYQAGINYYIK